MSKYQHEVGYDHHDEFEDGEMQYDEEDFDEHVSADARSRIGSVMDDDAHSQHSYQDKFQSKFIHKQEPQGDEGHRETGY